MIDNELDSGRLMPAGPGFTAGLITGGIVGCVLALAFAPRSGMDFRRRVARAARDLGAAAARSQAPTALDEPSVERRTPDGPSQREPADPELRASAMTR